jgi:hypothetical protein
LSESGPIAARRSCSSPAVSRAPIFTDRVSRMSPCRALIHVHHRSSRSRDLPLRSPPESELPRDDEVATRRAGSDTRRSDAQNLAR